MRRILSSTLLLASAAALAASPSVTISPVATGPGHQTDPHISGAKVAYTNTVSGAPRIHYVDLATSGDAQVPAVDGFNDRLSDISGSRIVFSREQDGISNIYHYALGAVAPVGIDLRPDAIRSHAAIGNDLIAFEDFSTGTNYVYAVILPGGTPVSVGSAAGSSRPAVSHDGSMLAWRTCTLSGCTITAAERSGTAFASTTVTSNADSTSTVDVNGKIAVYIRGGDVVWQQIGAATSNTVTFAGADTNPNISGNIVAFEHNDGAQTDIYVKDISSAEAPVRLTNTAANETLNDVFVEGNQVRVVFAVPNGADGFDVMVASFQLNEGGGVCQFPTVDPATSCDALWDDVPASASFTLERDTGAPQTASASATATGDAIVCVRSTGTASGVVSLDGAQVFGTDSFNPHVQKLSAAATVNGEFTVSGEIRSKPGSKIEVKVYAVADVCTNSALVSGLGSGNDLGCSSTGGSALVWLAAIAALLVVLRPRLQQVRVRGGRR